MCIQVLLLKFIHLHGHGYRKLQMPQHRTLLENVLVTMESVSFTLYVYMLTLPMKWLCSAHPMLCGWGVLTPQYKIEGQSQNYSCHSTVAPEYNIYKDT